MEKKKKVSVTKAQFENYNEKTFGEYGDDKWKEQDGDNYEWNRFEKHKHGRRKNKRELSAVDAFLKTLPKQSVVLDTPCGMGRFTKSILAYGHVPLSVDINFDRARATNKRYGKEANVAQGDVFNLPFADKSCDVVLCFRLFHHLPDNLIYQALMEMQRVSNMAFVTFYSKSCVKFMKKSIQGKKLSGQYYAFKHMQHLAKNAGWSRVEHLNAFDIMHNLHYLKLS